MADEEHAGIRVVVIDDDPFALKQLVRELEKPGIGLVVPCAQEAECLEAVARHQPHVIAVDLHLDGEQDGGVRLIKKIRLIDDQARCIIVAGTDPRGQFLVESLLAGAQGYWRKGYAREKLAAIVLRLAAGEPSIEPELARWMYQYWQNPTTVFPQRPDLRRPKLSPRQAEVLELITQGKTNKEIADELCIAPATVKTYVRQIMHAYNIAGRAGKERLKVLSQLRDTPGQSPPREEGR